MTAVSHMRLVLFAKTIRHNLVNYVILRVTAFSVGHLNYTFKFAISKVGSFFSNPKTSLYNSRNFSGIGEM